MAKDCKMAKNWSCWQNDDGAIVEYSQVAAAPCKDFFHIFVTPEQFIFRLWKIVPPTRSDYQNHPPSEVKDSWEDFEHDERLHSEITRVGGSRTLEYLLNVCHGRLDYLPRLPRDVLLRMILMLDLEDITALSQVSSFFRELCNSNDLWEKIYMKYSETPITAELHSLAAESGWKKLFYTNKLQLQMHLRRRQQHVKGHAFMTEPME